MKIIFQRTTYVIESDVITINQTKVAITEYFYDNTITKLECII